MRVSIGTTASCAPGIKWKMANPSTTPVAASWAEPTYTGGVGGPAVAIINDAFAARVRSKEEAGGGPTPEGCWGNVKGRVRGPLPLASPGSPNKLNRAVAADVPLFTSLKVVVQFSSAA